MEQKSHSPPRARDRGLVCRDLPDGLMVYDEERHRAHSLNATAAFVWRHCDGQTTIPELTLRLRQVKGVPADEAMIWLALDRLEKEHLLQQPLVRPDNADRCGRRAALQKLGKVGVTAALVPLVTSITAPKALAASSKSNVGACAGKSAGSPCVFNQNKMGTCRSVDGHLVCSQN
jgi:coenzyme PQQ synthesis protein D (PqqD)